MFTSPNRLETNKWNLHRTQQSNDVKDGVADKQSLREPAHEKQHKYMQRNQVDYEYVATPC